MHPEVLLEHIRKARAATSHPFGVLLFRKPDPTGHPSSDCPFLPFWFRSDKYFFQEHSGISVRR
ncbi:MAG: hypothetical protein WBK43_13155 [Prolixibacteraceae bacterium]|nr:hypothetical protein [Prolixibacteraceae bacterium]HNU78642.1 hypothetical protein [Prolixibacteraceae bacterium]HNZ68265.1 hypothetical protein [Prolixibacteraceae bacterium]HOC85666.1 hypothetical protein [Prolixibacteraceae bacterium]HOF54389.1 hypothetical protein [Prolixibacteraceae bacterium]